MDALSKYHQIHHIKVEDDTTATTEIIRKLPPEDKIQIAIERITAGYGLYFTTGHVHSQSPFPFGILESVKKAIVKLGYEIQENEDRDEGDSAAYGDLMKGWLNGIVVSASKQKANNMS